MTRGITRLVLRIILVLFFLPRSADAVVVVRRASTVSITESKGTLRLALRSDAPLLYLEVRAEIVDGRGRVRGRGERNQTLQAGESSLELDILAEGRFPLDLTEVTQLRVEYRIDPSEGEPVTGYLPVALPTDHTVELFAMHSGRAFVGEPYPLTVQARLPETGGPVAGVEVSAVLGPEGARAVRARGVTDSDGVVRLELDTTWVVGSSSSEQRLVVSGGQGPYATRSIESVWIDGSARLSVFLDKPAYRRGDVMRFFARLTHRGGRPVSGVPIRATRIGPYDERLRIPAHTTSKSGIAAFAVPLSERAVPGHYRVEVESFGGLHAKAVTSALVDPLDPIPFVVDAAPVEPVLLPGERASVAVSAYDARGLPISNGRVRVLRHGETVGSARLDRSGNGRVDVDLPPVGPYLEEIDRTYDDFVLEARVTNPATDEEAATRFTVRLSRDPIHVYLLDLRYLSDAFVVTTTAAGEPLPCDVVVESATAGAPWKQSLRTNALGLGRLGLGDDRGRAPTAFVVSAVSADGRKSTVHRTRLYGDEADTSVTLERTLHLPGQPIRATIHAPQETSPVWLVLSRQGGEVVETRSVALEDGWAKVSFDSDERFRGVYVVSFFDRNHEGTSWTPAAKGVAVFPPAPALRLSASPSRSAYRPGETAVLNVSATSTTGEPLGVAVSVRGMDRALESIAWDAYGAAYRRWPWDRIPSPHTGQRTYGGLTRSDLLSLDPSAWTSALDDLAALLVHDGGALGPPPMTRSHRFPTGSFYEGAASAELSSVFGALARIYREPDFPRNGQEASHALLLAGAPLDLIPDPWGSSYRLDVAPEADVIRVILRSDGRDGVPDSDDDLELEADYPYFAAHARELERWFDADRDGAPRTIAEAVDACRRAGLDLEALRDPWGRRYDVVFEGEERHVAFAIRSRGPDGLSDTAGELDDVEVYRRRWRFFDWAPAELRTAVELYGRRSGKWPANSAELAQALEQDGIPWRELKDAWQEPFDVRFAGHNVQLRSRGPDARRGTSDDFTVVAFDPGSRGSGRADPKAAALGALPGFAVLRGTVTDAGGEPMADATVKIRSSQGDRELSQFTDESGRFAFDLRAGLQAVRVDSPLLDAVAAEELQVEADEVLTRAYRMVPEEGLRGESFVLRLDRGDLGTEPLSTPHLKGRPEPPDVRLRYANEPLLWLPDGITEADGTLSIPIDLPDDITRWRVDVFASTLDGREARTEVELRVVPDVERDP